MLKTRIKEFRAARDMDQATLAGLVGVRRETIGRLEKGLLLPDHLGRQVGGRGFSFEE